MECHTEPAPGPPAAVPCAETTTKEEEMQMAQDPRVRKGGTDALTPNLEDNVKMSEEECPASEDKDQVDVV